MGLLDKIKGTSNQNKEKKEFEPVIIDTTNVMDELKHVASSHNININRLTFKLLKTTTTFKVSKDEEYRELTPEDKKLFEDNDFLLNPELKIKQHYKIEIFEKKEKEDEIIPEITLSGNRLLTKIVATVKKNLDVKYFSKLEDRIIKDINMKKIRSKILVGIRDENMYKEVKKIVASIRVKNLLEEDCVFVVCQGLDKVPSIDDKLIFHYKNKVKKEDKQGRVDYARRGFILAVSKGEVIIEYIKPQEGISGRNCQGRLLNVKEPNVKYDGNISHTENIIKKEDDEKIKYIANKNGYVNVDGGTYDIQDQIEIESVDFKSTGSIETDLNSDVKINIKEKDVFKDAIGPGMSVETSELHVDGNVGSGAKIVANDVEIKGQTHKTSVIEAKNAQIAVHRGNVTADNIEIERLEGGTVTGNIVKIKNIIGGDVTAKEIYIEELASNAKLTSSHLIDIQKLRGHNNKFIIDPVSTKEYGEKIEKTNERIKKATIELKPLPKQLENKKALIEKNKPIIDEIKNRIIDLKKNGKTPPLSLLNKIRSYQKMVNEYNNILKEYKNKKHELSVFKEELHEIQNQIFMAKVVNHSPWTEFNEIKFKLVSPPVEVTYNAKEHEIAREITLKRNSDEDFTVSRSSEYTS